VFGCVKSALGVTGVRWEGRCIRKLLSDRGDFLPILGQQNPSSVGSQERKSFLERDRSVSQVKTHDNSYFFRW